MKTVFCEMSMALLIQQNKSLREEFSKFGFDSSDDALRQMKMLINNNFLNHKVKAALYNMFKKHVEDKSGYFTAMYNGFQPHYRTHEPVDGKRFFVWNIEETNGEYEYTHKGVVALEENESPIEWLDVYTSGFYADGDGEKQDDGYSFDGGILCFPGEIKEVSKDEYDVLVKYI